MIRTTFLLLSLVVLGGASLPPGPCGGTPAFGVPLPSHLDMAGSAGGTVSPSVAMVVPNLLGRQEVANQKATRISIAGFENAMKMYAQDHDGQFPPGNGETIIQMLMTPEQSAESAKPRPPYLEKVPLDAWKQPLRYEYPASGNRQSNIDKPAIWSAGPDHQDDTADDVNNWSQN